MRPVDAVWSELVASRNFRLEAKLEIDGVEYTKITAPRISRPAMTSPLSVGSCFSSSLKVSVLTEDEIAKSATVKVLCRLTNGTAATVCSDWMPFGTYYIATRSDKTDAGIVTLECYDVMMKANAPFFDSTLLASWPQPMDAVAEEIASNLGITIDSRTTINGGDDYVVYQDTTLTQWQVLCYIAACHGGNWVITEDNALRLIPLVDTTRNEDAEVFSVPAVMGSLTTGKAITISGVEITDTSGNTYTAGNSNGHVVSITDNPCVSQTICDALYSQLAGLSYVPYTATKALYDPAIELGDYIDIGDKVSGVLYAQELTLDYAFRSTIEAPSSEELANEYPYTDPMLQVMRAEVANAASKIEQKVDSIRMEVSQEVGADGKVYAAITLRIGPNAYTGQILIEGNLDVSGQLSADALYALEGDIASLTVNRLTTSKRIKLYLAGDTSDDNYLDIQGEQVAWMTAIYNGGTEQAVNPSGLPIYWEADPAGEGAVLGTDGYPYLDGVRIFTTTAVTEWPVTVYTYDEYMTGKFAFEAAAPTWATDQSTVYVPVLTLGAGDNNGYNKARIVKAQDGLEIRYTATSGKELGVRMGADGYMDLHGLRAITAISVTEASDGTVTIANTLEGDVTETIVIGADADGNPASLTYNGVAIPLTFTTEATTT